MTVLRCNRCSCPVEEPITYADEQCDDCMHVPLCTACAECHRVEVNDEGDQPMNVVPPCVIDRIRAMQTQVLQERADWGDDAFYTGWLGGVEDVLAILLGNRSYAVEPDEGEFR